MEREDSFFKKIHPLEKLPHIMDRKHRFARDEKTADKTLGFVLVRHFGNIYIKCGLLTEDCKIKKTTLH